MKPPYILDPSAIKHQEKNVSHRGGYKNFNDSIYQLKIEVVIAKKMKSIKCRYNANEISLIDLYRTTNIIQ